MVLSKMLLAVKTTVKRTALGRTFRNKYQRRGLKSREQAIKEIKRYLGESIETERLNTLADDMLIEAKEHSVDFYEYLMFKFYEMSSDERREYIPTLERIGWCERMNNIKNEALFDDKSATYLKFKKYYHRDLIGIFGKKGELEIFKVFVSKHPRFIVKPYDGACGRGIKIIDSNGQSVEYLFSKLTDEYRNGFVAEELILQCLEMAKFHPESVNTVRMTTIRYDDRVDIIHPFLRTGRGKSVVDNGGSGGIINAIDADTGKIIGSADEMGIHYINHPDSNIPLIGYQMPCWDEAKALARELAYIMPDTRYCGWDLALTDNGWVLQEANDRGEFVGFQLPIKKGFRSELMNIIKELGV